MTEIVNESEQNQNKEEEEDSPPLTPKIEEVKYMEEENKKEGEEEEEDKPLVPTIMEPEIEKEIQDRDKIVDLDNENEDNKNEDENEEKENEEENENKDENSNNEASGESNENKSKSLSSGHDYTKTKQATFENVKLLYRNKKNALKGMHSLLEIYKKFWDLCEHTIEGEIPKKSFLDLFRKMYKVILPIFNYGEIDKFVEGIWDYYSKGRLTLANNAFNKAIFSFTHRWCVHINHDEYENFLNMIYSRITRIKKILSEGRERIFYPSIKVTLYNQITKEDFENSTWEFFDNEEQLHIKLYETYEEYEQEKNNTNNNNNNNNNDNNSPVNRVNSQSNGGLIKARPRLKNGDRNLYESNKNFLLYNEDVFYSDQEEIDRKDLNSFITYEFLDDKDLVIFGYPTQFVINKFINEPNTLSEIECVEENDYDSFFKITDYQPYEQHKIFLKITEKEKLITFLQDNKSFILLRDIFMINNNLSLGNDFVNDELNVINNLRRSEAFDRYVDIYEIKLPDETTTKSNLNNLIINPIHRKAFGNVFDEKLKKIGTQSELWTETIESKLEKIFFTKFTLIHLKLLNLNLSYSLFESNIEVIKDEISEKKRKFLQEEEEDLSFFDKFKSKNGIKFDNWDSDNDLYDEANKKSPVILVIGPPRIGKTQVAMKLSKDLEMEILEPQKFFDKIFQKVAEYEEKMLTWEEENPPEENKEGEEGNGEEGDEEKKDEEKKKEDKKKAKKKKDENPYLASWDPPPKKREKPGVDSVLNEIELAVYNDIINGNGISELNMQRMFMYILHSDFANSRGIVIDMISNIFEKNNDPNNDTQSFCEKILNGFYGKITVDYVVDLYMDKDELRERNNKMKFNMKTLKIISERDIELMKKPKVAKKEILEDEIEYDEENKPIVPEPEPEVELTEEELEKIPKKEDLLEITDNDKIFEEQLKYYEDIQYPKVMEYVETLKTNYYIKIDTTGLDYDEISNLIKCQLDFANPLRPIAKNLEGGDFKGLLMDGREGVIPFRRWSPWKQIDPVALKDDYLILTGSTEFPASYFSRVFLFVSDDNRKKFLENPKKYICEPPQVPQNYRISIIGPPQSGKKKIANMLSQIYHWKIINMEEIFDSVREYQKTWEEPEINSVYTRRVHFSASEFKEVLANSTKKPADRKPDNFVSKIVFMCDYLGIPLDKKRTKEQFIYWVKYHSDKLVHLFNRMQEAVDRVEQAKKDELIRIEEEEAEKKRLEEEAKLEEELFKEMTECARSLYEVEKDKRAQAYLDHLAEKEKEKEMKEKELEEKEKRNPFPPEEDYVIEDLRSDNFFLAFDEKGNHPRVNGIILLNHPLNEDEVTKLGDFNIKMDRIIYIKDETDEGIKELILRRNPNFANLDEEKQGAEIEKVKAEVAKYEEIITMLKEKYNVNNEECVIEAGYAEPLAQLQLKLENALNPFNIKVDSEEKVILPGDIGEDKYPLSRGPFGLFCPVIYKEDNWLFYSPEANELQVNQRLYRISGEKEMEKFRNNPAMYVGQNGSLLPIDVPPPHIMITGYQGAGTTFYSDLLCKQFKFSKREIQNEFMKIWEKQRLDRKSIRIQKKREELEKQNAEIQEKNEEAKKENPDAEGEPLINIDDAIKEDAALDEEGEDYNAVENDKSIFKSLFNPLTPTIYDAGWFNMEEKVSTPFIDLLYESRRVPNVMVIFKVNMKSIMDRHFHMEEIDKMYDKMLKESNDKRKQKEDDLIKQKKQEKFDELKAEFEAEGENNDNQGEEEGEEKKEEKPKKTMPTLEEIQIELTPEELEDIWKSPDPDLIEKDALIQQEKDKLSQRFENNVNNIQALIDALKEKGIPVIEINNDTNKDNVYKNLLLELEPYINNRKNLIEKQLVNDKKFENPLSLRKVRDLLYNSEVYQQSVYSLLSPVNPSQLCIRTDYPLVYRDRVYVFNSPEEKKYFIENPLDYRTGLECPKDSYPMRGRTIIFVIGNECSGKSTISKMMEEYMGYKRVTVRKAILECVEKLHDCHLKQSIMDTIYNGEPTHDDIIFNIIYRRISMEDMINDNVVIDGFPFSLWQANILADTFKPDFIFVAECDYLTNIKRCLSRKMFKGIPEVVNERFNLKKSHLEDILSVYRDKQYDIRYFDTTKSKWYLKDQIAKILENRKKYEMKFARNLSLDLPCQLTCFTPKKLISSLLYVNHQKTNLLLYSPIALKTEGIFKYNKHINDSFNNFIIYTPKKDIIKEEKLEEVESEKNEENKKKEEKKEENNEENKEENNEENKEENNEENNEDNNQENNEDNNQENNEDNNEEEKEEEKKEEGKREEGEGGIGSTYRNLSSDSNRIENSSEINSPKEKEDEDEEENFVTQFHLLSNENEVEQFMKNPEDFKNYILEVENVIHPPKNLSAENIAEILYQDEIIEKVEEESENDSDEGDIDEENDEEHVKLGLNIRFEYQDCCPVTIIEDNLMKIGKLDYALKYGGKYYKFLSMPNLRKFKENPNKYINLELPVKKVNEEDNEFAEKQISFNNTVNYLEFTFGSLITKGMLELSNHRIKYPYLNVRETSLKYLALYLKANNPNNNEYAKKKYAEILREFIKNSKLPFELLNCFETYHKESDKPLRKQLNRKQLDNVSVKYDDLMEKAKIQNNTRFANFFKRNIDNK